VEDRARRRVGLLETIEEDADDRLVGHELAAAHVAIRLTAQRRALGDGGPKKVARGEHRNTEVRRDDRSLGPFSRSRRTQEDDDGHGRGNGDVRRVTDPTGGAVEHRTSAARSWLTMPDISG